MSASAKTFWASTGLLAYSVVGYPLALRALRALRGAADPASADMATLAAGSAALPRVAMLLAAHDEEDVIEDWVRMAMALDWPRERLELIVACDGCTDRTAERARAAGADRVLELERGGKVAALHAALAAIPPDRAPDVLAFSDANSTWAPGALRTLVGRLAEPATGYVCGRLELRDGGGDNQEGLYWRYEMAVRSLESDLAGITAGNGAINVVRAEAFLRLAHDRGLDISLPFELAKRGWSSRYEPAAVATEPMAASIADEQRRKRRMLAGSWRTLLATGMLSPRGYTPTYWLEILSHRLLRYAAPLLHLAALGSSLARARRSPIAALATAVQLAVLGLAAAPRLGGRIGLISRYYVSMSSASALGLWDFLRGATPRTWSRAEGTRER